MSWAHTVQSKSAAEVEDLIIGFYSISSILWERKRGSQATCWWAIFFFTGHPPPVLTIAPCNSVQRVESLPSTSRTCRLQGFQASCTSQVADYLVDFGWLWWTKTSTNQEKSSPWQNYYQTCKLERFTNVPQQVLLVWQYFHSNVLCFHGCGDMMRYMIWSIHAANRIGALFGNSLITDLAGPVSHHSFPPSWKDLEGICLDAARFNDVNMMSISSCHTHRRLIDVHG